MNVRRSTLTAIGIASAVALSPIVASPVSAGDSGGLTKPEMMASLTKVADLPANVRSQARSSTVRSAPVRTTGYGTGSNTHSPFLCWGLGGSPDEGRRPATSAFSLIDLGENVSTTNYIYNYGTPAKAKSAWRALVKDARKCNGSETGTVPADEGAPAVDMTVEAKFAQTPKLLGARGFTITTDISMSTQPTEEADKKSLLDSYAAYRIVGPAIESVIFGRFSPYSGSVGVNEDRRAFTRTETNRVAKRLWVRWVD